MNAKALTVLLNKEEDITLSHSLFEFTVCFMLQVYQVEMVEGCGGRPSSSSDWSVSVCDVYQPKYMHRSTAL